MKVITKFIIMIFTILCLCHYFEIDIIKTFSAFIEKGKQVQNSIPSIIVSEDNDNNTIPGNSTSTVVITENTIEQPVENKTEYDEIVDFIIGQKKDKKLIESYRMTDKENDPNLKEKSFISDNGLAVIALSSLEAQEARSTAEDILKSLASIQNEDGSWFDFYDTSGQIMKVSGKDYKIANTANNSIVLYAYSYYSIMTGDNQFKDIMKKSADFILSRSDGKNQGLYDYEVSEKGSRTLKSNVYSYFGLREYAMSNMFNDYQEFKDKLDAADSIASFVIDNCIDKGGFIKGYTGKNKDTTSNIDTYILGSLLVKACKQGEKIKYETKDLENLLAKLYKNIGDLEGYRIDADDKNKDYIWCEGTCKIPIVFLKLGNRNRSNDVLGFVSKYDNMIPKDLSPRGVPYSTNFDTKIDMTRLESVSASAWAVMAYRCYSDDNINNFFFGKEEDVFKTAARE